MSMTNASRKHEGLESNLLEVYIFLNLSKITANLEVSSPESKRKCNWELMDSLKSSNLNNGIY